MNWSGPSSPLFRLERSPLRPNRSYRSTRTLLTTRGLWILFLILMTSNACQPSGESTTRAPAQTIDLSLASFLKNKTCKECHIKEFREWSKTHHDLAMQEATGESVLGLFENTRFNHFGVTSRFFKKKGRFFVNTDGPDGTLHDFEIKYILGMDPLQQVLIEMDDGRLQALTIAWDIRNQRWFHLYPDHPTPYNNPLHWTNRFQNLNSRCGECHTTNFRKGYDTLTDRYQSTWTEMNVSCQSCHGPGEFHVIWAKEQKTGGDLDTPNKGLLVDFNPDDVLKEIETCARCHSRRHSISPVYQPGRPFLDNFVPALLSEDLYHPDGQIIEEVYVYGSFIQSKKIDKGVGCSDCHHPHTLKLKASGNRLCVRCHQSNREYDTPKHHFHKTNSAGAQCINCHMPTRKTRVIDTHHDHSFRVPRPDLSIKIGTPNACNDCHLDQSIEWARETVQRWYGSKEKPRHFGEVLAAGRLGSEDAETRLVKLVRNKNQPSIVRATALDLLQYYGIEGVAVMMNMLIDDDPLVRVAAVGGLDRLSPRERPQWAAPLLKDPIRAVRIETARVLTSIPQDYLNEKQKLSFETALTEYIETQKAHADRPSAQLNLGIIYSNMGKTGKAEEAYQTAIRLAPDFLPPRFNLANFYNGLGRNDEAEQQLRLIIQQFPKSGEAHYSLGLLLAELGNLKESAAELTLAAGLLPEEARVHYNYALALQHLGRQNEATTALLIAEKLTPNDPSIVNAVASHYMQEGEWRKALPYAQKLVELLPNAPGPPQMVEKIQSELNADSGSDP